MMCKCNMTAAALQLYHQYHGQSYTRCRNAEGGGRQQWRKSLTQWLEHLGILLSLLSASGIHTTVCNALNCKPALATSSSAYATNLSYATCVKVLQRFPASRGGLCVANTARIVQLDGLSHLNSSSRVMPEDGKTYSHITRMMSSG